MIGCRSTVAGRASKSSERSSAQRLLSHTMSTSSRQRVNTLTL